MTVRDEPVPRETRDDFLAVRHLSKTFSGQRALADVDLVIKSGEIHALLGQNGSGKSTLIKTLAGLYQPDPGGSIVVDGHELATGSPRHSQAAGLRFIHQDLGLVGSLRVLDNLELGSGSARVWLSERRLRQRAQQVLASHGLNVDVTAPTQHLTLAQQSMLAIIRAIHDLPGGRGLLVLDEPTASLPPREVAHLLELLVGLRTRGLSILYVTHRLSEVLALSDEVTVLRDGRLIASRPTREVDHASLVELIVGRNQTEVRPGRAVRTLGRRAPGLRVSNLTGGRLLDVSFHARAGGVLGITGLVGSGYEETLSHVFGAKKADSGEVTVHGLTIPRGRCDLAVRAGVGFVPSDRDSLGSIPSWTLGDNLTLPAIPIRARSRLVDSQQERQDSEDWTRRLGIEPPDPHRLMSLFSGGNRQRVVVGRWLRCASTVLLLDEPTIGVDVAGKGRIHRLLKQAAESGAVVVIASSDHEEVAALCDRVLVLRNGSVAAELAGDEITADALFVESTGIADPDALTLSLLSAPEPR